MNNTGQGGLKQKKYRNLQKTPIMTNKQKIRLAVLASGSGTNAANLVKFFRGHPEIVVSLIVSSNPEAHVLQRAERAGVTCEVITKPEWANRDTVTELFRHYGIDGVVLAGYLLLIPEWFIRMYPLKILNIHPALLPAFGGRGMYGMHVHRTVIEAGAKSSGISIHVVNEKYDKGEVIFRAELPVRTNDTAESLARRIQELEHMYYPEVVEKYFLTSSVLCIGEK